MKNKLRGFGLKRSETKDKIDLLPPAQLDELAQAARVFTPSLSDAFGVHLFFLARLVTALSLSSLNCC
jgi:hypothetical protein